MEDTRDSSRVGKSLLPPVVDLRAATDASDYGWGAWMETPTGVVRWGGIFPRHIAREHINYKELLTVWYLLRSSPVVLKGKILEIGVDNTTAMCGTFASRAELGVRTWPG